MMVLSAESLLLAADPLKGNSVKVHEAVGMRRFEKLGAEDCYLRKILLYHFRLKVGRRVSNEVRLVARYHVS